MVVHANFRKGREAKRKALHHADLWRPLPLLAQVLLKVFDAWKDVKAVGCKHGCYGRGRRP